MNSFRTTVVLVAYATALAISGCGGGSGSGGGGNLPPSPPPPPPAATFTIGGSVSGLAPNASGLTLMNGNDTLAINANGTFAFPTALTNGSSYDVRVATLPFDPNQFCAVANGAGVVANAAVTAPSITCTRSVPRFATSLDFYGASYSQYAIDASTGQLRARGFAHVGSFPVDVSLSGYEGRISFVLSRGESKLHAFRRDLTTGRVTEGSGSPQITGAIDSTGDDPPNGASTLTVHPRLPFVYVANGGGTTTVAGFRFDPDTAALTQIPGSPFSAGSRPVKLAIEPTGRFAFVTNRDSETISAFTIDQSTGALTPNGTVATGATSAAYPAVHRSGKFLYVPNGSGSISAYTIGATGALTAIPNSPFVIRPDLAAPLVMHPSGRYLYAKTAPSANARAEVVAVAINQDTGALSIIGQPVTVGMNPQSMEGEQSGRYLFVANRGALPVTHDTPGSISVLRIDPATGALTALPGVDTFAPFSARLDPSGNFLYSASPEGNVVRRWQFDTTTGALSPIADSTDMIVRWAPVYLLPIASADGEPATFRSSFGYVPNRTTGAISAYRINPSGLFTETTGVGPVAELQGVKTLAVIPIKNYLAAVNDAGVAIIRTFPIDPTTGALGASSPGTGLGSNSPTDLVSDLSGRFIYAPDSLLLALRQFGVNAADGSLILRPSSTAGPVVALAVHPNGALLYHIGSSEWGAHGVDPETGRLYVAALNSTSAGNTAIAIHPSGSFAYITRLGAPGQIGVYRITGTGVQPGPLVASTPISSGGNNPASIAIHPTGRFLWVVNQGGSNNIAAFRIAADTGLLTAVNTIPLASTPVSVRASYGGDFVYVVDTSANIRTFQLDNVTGALTATSLVTPSPPQSLTLTEDIE